MAQIAERLGRSPATIKAYFYDLTGEKARAVKARYVGVCRGGGAHTQPRNGKGDAYRYRKRWTRRDSSMDVRLGDREDWLKRYGGLPSSTTGRGVLPLSIDTRAMTKLDA